MRTTVSLEDFRSGRLPPVCVRTGEPARRLVRADALAMPKPEVLGLMTVLGELGGLAAGFGRGVRGRLPMTDGAATREAILPLVQVVALVALAVSFAGVVQPALFALAPAAVVTLVGTVVLRLTTSPYVRIEPDGETVSIARAHPRFAAAARIWGAAGGGAAPD